MLQRSINHQASCLRQGECAKPEQPRTVLAGGLTTLWPHGFNEPSLTLQAHAGCARGVRDECKALVLECLAKESPQTVKSLSRFGSASIFTLEKVLIELFNDGLVTRSRKGNRASPYFYEIKHHD